MLDSEIDSSSDADTVMTDKTGTTNVHQEETMQQRFLKKFASVLVYIFKEDIQPSYVTG